MLFDLPNYISLVFILTAVFTLFLFIWSIRNSNDESTQKKSLLISIGLIIWLVIQAIFTISNVYNTDEKSFPPKLILLGVLPILVIIVVLFITSSGRRFIDGLPLKHLTYLHVVRVPVEIVLYWLALHKAIPELMTFEGRNFDILAGITAPFVAYLGFVKLKMSRRGLLIWNFICLGLLINIVMNAVLSAPTPIQQFAFDQPNIAILNFPFSWLPTFIVPVVLFCHLVSIRQLLSESQLQ